MACGEHRQSVTWKWEQLCSPHGWLWDKVPLRQPWLWPCRSHLIVCLISSLFPFLFFFFFFHLIDIFQWKKFDTAYSHMVWACIVCTCRYGLAVHFSSNLFLSCDYIVFPQTLGLNFNRLSQMIRSSDQAIKTGNLIINLPITDILLFREITINTRSIPDAIVCHTNDNNNKQTAKICTINAETSSLFI